MSTWITTIASLQICWMRVQACCRGPQLYDTDETKTVVEKWGSLYKQHLAILDSDLIHLRRVDGRDLDYILHVNHAIEVQGFLMVYKPLLETVSKKLKIPLYYTGIVGTTECQASQGKNQTYSRDDQRRIELPIEVSGKGNAWFIIKHSPKAAQNHEIHSTHRINCLAHQRRNRLP